MKHPDVRDRIGEGLRWRRSPLALRRAMPTSTKIADTVSSIES